MAKKTTIEVCHEHLFSSVDEMTRASISQQMQLRIKRIRSIYTLWNDNPLKREKELRDIILKQYGISQSEAYEDLKIIKQLLGDFAESSKSWHRFKFNAMIEKTYSKAELRNNVMAMAMAADKYAKYNQLDREDGERLPFDKIVPQIFFPTSDPTVLGIKAVPNLAEKITALKKKYGDEIEDVEYVEVGYDFQILKDAESYGK